MPDVFKQLAIQPFEAFGHIFNPESLYGAKCKIAVSYPFLIAFLILKLL
jgi:hypothetical protein